MNWSRRLVGTVRPSSIRGGSGVLNVLPAEAARLRDAGGRLFLLTDDNVRAAWGDSVLGLLGAGLRPGDIRSVAPGETSKGIPTLSQCWDWLAAQGARRNDTLVALGGGVVGDLAGFVAASYLRGMGLWQIPTTLLSQVDSSVGGKNGINLSAGKNLVGAFYQPELVVIDAETLATLPEDEYVGGLGEVVKYALLSGPNLLALLEENTESIRRREPLFLSTLVRRCVDYKADVVDQDEFDQGRRAVLNLGHTTAHALEKTLGYGSISHGNAVALGLLVALAVSEKTQGLDPEVRARVRVLFSELGLPTAVPLPSVSSLLAAAYRDKKVVADRILFVALPAIGAPVWGVDVSPELFSEALEVIRA